MASLMHRIPTPETSITAAKPQTSTLCGKVGIGIATGLRLENAWASRSRQQSMQDERLGPLLRVTRGEGPKADVGRLYSMAAALHASEREEIVLSSPHAKTVRRPGDQVG